MRHAAISLSMDLLSGGAEYPLAQCGCRAQGSVHASTQLEDQERDTTQPWLGDECGRRGIADA